MTVASTPPVPRRTVLIGGLVACGAGAAVIAAYMFPALFGQKYPATPFDDLLSKLPDRNNAAKMGAAVLAQQKSFDAHVAARVLRARLGTGALSAVLARDLSAGRMLEFRGWIVPETLAMLCALAAFVAPPEAAS